MIKNKNNSLVIPSNVETIGSEAFYNYEEYTWNSTNIDLERIEYKGNSESILNNTTNWYNPSNTQLNPTN